MFSQRRIQKSNHRFMYGMMAMAVIVMAVVTMFLMWCGDKRTEPTEAEAPAEDMSPYMPVLKVGEQAPDIRLPRYDNGDTLSLSSLRGRYVLVDFWASWCGDCRRELPIMEEALANYTGQMDVFSVSFDNSPEALANFLAQHPVPYPVLCDYSPWKESATTQAYQLAWIPTFYIIDPDGRIAGSGIDGESLKALLQ